MENEQPVNEKPKSNTRWVFDQRWEQYTDKEKKDYVLRLNKNSSIAIIWAIVFFYISMMFLLLTIASYHAENENSKYADGFASYICQERGDKVLLYTPTIDSGVFEFKIECMNDTVKWREVRNGNNK